MATELITSPQSLAEVRARNISFAADLPGSVTVSSATATHTPPSGVASAPVVDIKADGTGTVTLGPVTVTGWHLVDVTANLSDGQKSQLRLVIPVIF